MISMRVLVAAAFLLAVGAAPPALAQTSRMGLDVAAQTTGLRVTDSGSTSAGVGGRLSKSLSRWLAIDAELTFFPKDDFVRVTETQNDGRLVFAHHRRRTDVLAGVKAGRSWDRFGVFAKVRPGFTRLTHKSMGCVGQPCSLMLPAPAEYRTEFAFDVGGMVEFYPTRRTVARADLGDVIIRNRSSGVPPCQECTTHNFTSRVSFGLRF